MTDVLRVTILGPPVPAQMGVMVGAGKVIKGKRSTAYGQLVRQLTGFAVMRARWTATREDSFSVVLRAFVGTLRVIDVDNIAKCALDGIKGVAFPDDRQVMRLLVEKRLDRLTPRLEVEIVRLVDPDQVDAATPR